MLVQNPRLKFIICLLTLGSSTLLIGKVNAANVSNDNFQLEIEQFEPVEVQKPIPTPLPEAQQEQSSPGIAFLPSPFSFSLSHSLIDFGVLSATNPVTRAITLKIVSPGSGYQVFAFENNTLRSKKDISIPDTTCDNGSCSEITASLWENNLTYGFGFRCDSENDILCSEDFKDKQAFKQFSDHSKKELIQPLIQHDSRTNEDQAQVTYRLNISGTQQKQAYANTVTYIAVPNF